ncbi:Hypothetical protein, putative [Bodo saltans]|uniref:Uncharacterized protein n=1 Tax=Bodo saltans TaxID=75058 RepID=A0A0S4J8E1_BODSA|nr:Hypothetical protein, putative [Bodo saltans]|eukprot:CUG87520.1 Hypothetical protein, putative [Bodo saltans]
MEQGSGDERSAYITGLRSSSANDQWRIPKLETHHRPSSTSLRLPLVRNQRTANSAAPVLSPRDGTSPNRRRLQTPGASITAGAVRRNVETKLRYEALCSVDGLGAPITTKRQSIHTTDVMGMLSDLSNFARYDDYSHHLPSPNSKSRRKTLKERTMSITNARSTVRDEMVGKLKLLHKDQEVRQGFFQDVKELQRLRNEERHERGVEILHRNMQIARCSTPAVLEKQLIASCQQRDTHMEIVQQRKEQFVADRKAMFQNMVKRTNRTGVLVGDLQEIERERLEALLSSSWKNIVVVGCRAQFLFAELLEHRRGQMQQESENEARWEMFVTQQNKMIIVQMLWKAIMRRKRIAARYKAADCLRRFLYAVPRIQYQFRVAVRRTLNRVLSIQRHFRVIRVVRQVRRDAGVQVIDTVIRRITQEIDSEVVKLTKQKKHAESMATSAIKARKPIFEAQAAQFHQSIVESSRRKFTMSALTERSKREVVERVMAEREKLYRDRLREYGLEIMEKYMIEYNIEKVMKERQKEFDEAVAKKSITELEVVSIWELKRQARRMKSHRPVMLLTITDEDATSMFAPNGALTRLSQEDFSSQNEQLYSSRRAK